MTDVVLRPPVAGEGELFLSVLEPALVVIHSIGRDYRELMARGEFRSE